MADEENIGQIKQVEGETPAIDLDELANEVEDAGVEEPQTPETPPSEEPVELMDEIKKYAKEYGLDQQDFAKIDDPKEFARRITQQFKGYLGLSQRLEGATQGAVPPLPPPLAPQDVQPPVVPTAEDGAVDELLADPAGYFNKQMTQRDAKQQEQAYKIEMFQQDQAINQWSSTLPPEERAALMPHYNNDAVIRLKRSTGQIITLQDAQAAYESARMAIGNIQQVRQDALEEGAAATDAKRRAGLETGKKRSGQAPVLGLDALVEKYGKGYIPDAELNAAIAAEEAA